MSSPLPIIDIPARANSARTNSASTVPTNTRAESSGQLASKNSYSKKDANDHDFGREFGRAQDQHSRPNRTQSRETQERRSQNNHANDARSEARNVTKNETSQATRSNRASKADSQPENNAVSKTTSLSNSFDVGSEVKSEDVLNAENAGMLNNKFHFIDSEMEPFDLEDTGDQAASGEESNPYKDSTLIDPLIDTEYLDEKLVDGKLLDEKIVDGEQEGEGSEESLISLFNVESELEGNLDSGEFGDSIIDGINLDQKDAIKNSVTQLGEGNINGQPIIGASLTENSNVNLSPFDGVTTGKTSAEAGHTPSYYFNRGINQSVLQGLSTQKQAVDAKSGELSLGSSEADSELSELKLGSGSTKDASVLDKLIGKSDGELSLKNTSSMVGETLSRSLGQGGLQKEPIFSALSEAQLAEEKPLTASSLSTLAAVSNVNSAAAGGRVQMPVSITFGNPQWANMVAERSAMMFSQKIDHAELRLDPAELGPLQVKISVVQEQASVTFVSANSQVREALEQTSNRLKELLEEQSLDLVDVDVSDQSPNDEYDAQNDELSGQSSGLSGDQDVGELGESTTITVESTYGVDHYA